MCFFVSTGTGLSEQSYNILKSINNNTCRLTHGNFYKYCEIIDYIMAKNPDLCFPNIIDFLSANNDNKQKIAKRFKLTKI